MKILKEVTKPSGKKVIELVHVCCKYECDGKCIKDNNPAPTIKDVAKEVVEKVVEKVASKPKKKEKKDKKD